jgi:hypothetical protein
MGWWGKSCKIMKKYLIGVLKGIVSICQNFWDMQTNKDTLWGA